MSFPSIDPTSTSAWKHLSKHAEEMQKVQMRTLFANDPARFASFSQTDGDLLFDYSKNILTQETLKLLMDLAREC